MEVKNTDIKSLLSMVISEKKQLICFGAGKSLQWACTNWKEYNFFDNIGHIIDNDIEKQTSLFEFNGKQKPISSLEQCLQSINNINDVVFYISCLNYAEIFAQLSQEVRLKDVYCYINLFVRHRPIPYELPIHGLKGLPKIPKKIHYVWFGKKEIPKQNRIWMESWEKYCPDYEIIRWDESNYDVSKNPYMYEAYKEKKWAFVSDYARLDVIYENGGVYLDNDVELLRCIDPLLYNEAFCGVVGRSNDLGVATGLGFGGVKNFPIFNEMLKIYDDFSFYNDDGTLNLLNNNFYQNKVLEKYGFKGTNAIEVINGLCIYPADVLSPMDYLGNPIAYTNNTFAVHHFNASWLTSDETRNRQISLSICKEFWSKNLKE